MMNGWLAHNRLLKYIECHTVAYVRKRLQKVSSSAKPNPDYPRQLLIDVSVISKHDAGTGIQRVVRGILQQLISSPPPGYVIRLVAATRKRPYHYIRWDTYSAPVMLKDKISVREGDIFLGLDFSTHAIPRHYRQLARWKKHGMQLYFILYDLLPALHPEWFSDHAIINYTRWIKKIVILANSIMCISHVVKEDLTDWCKQHYQITADNLPVHVIPLGWDFDITQQSRGLPPDFEQVLAAIEQCPTALMVGTIEPRKGHAQVLEAFEVLWNEGKVYNLVIVGRPGWKTEILQKKMREHPERNKRFFWFDDASDETLLKLYKACSGVIIASLAEGFGLPLIEALGHAKPVLARDLPVFHEHTPHGIDYFVANDSIALCVTLINWLDKIKEPKTPLQTTGTICTWRDTTMNLVSLLTGTRI